MFCEEPLHKVLVLLKTTTLRGHKTHHKLIMTSTRAKGLITLLLFDRTGVRMSVTVRKRKGKRERERERQIVFQSVLFPFPLLTHEIFHSAVKLRLVKV